MLSSDVDLPAGTTLLLGTDFDSDVGARQSTVAGVEDMVHGSKH